MTFTPAEPHEVEYHRAGTTLTCAVSPGSGTPLVLLPGAMADASTWRPVAEAIDLPNPVITINRRGRAASGAQGAGYSVGVEIEDLRHILDQLGQVHLFGWSYGALIALETALTSEHIVSLIAYEPVGRPFVPEAVAPIRDAVADGDLDRAVTLINTEVSGFSAENVAELRRSPAWPVLRPLAGPAAEELAAINDYQPTFESYRALYMPVTLILGALNEGQAPYGTAFAPFAGALPQATAVRLPEQGHLAHVTAPTELAQAVSAAVTAAEASRS